MPLGTRTYQGGPQSSYGYGGTLTRDESRGVFGQVMGLVALTIGFLALGAFVGRHINGGPSFLFFLVALGCVFGLQSATRRGHDQLAIGLLFGMGLCMGLFISPLLVYYAKTDPGAVYQAAACTAGFTAAVGSFGWATRRDLSTAMRYAFYALAAFWVFLIIAAFVAIPGANLVYSLVGLAIFSVFIAFDFQRLRNANMTMAVPLAASIFLDVFNVFLMFLSLFGGGGRRR